MNPIAVVAIAAGAAAGCGADAPDRPMPNPPHGMPGHDHSQMHAPAAITEDD